MNPPFIAFFGGTPGIPELLIILFIILLLFGSKKLPGLSRSLGKSLSEFKRGKDEISKEIAEGAREAKLEAEEAVKEEVEEKIDA